MLSLYYLRNNVFYFGSCFVHTDTFISFFIYNFNAHIIHTINLCSFYVANAPNSKKVKTVIHEHEMLISENCMNENRGWVDM